MVVFRGWRLYGLAGTIFVYVAGILLLSIVSVQNSNQRRPRFRSLKDRDLLNLHRREMIAASAHPTLSWCRPLTFTDGSTMNNQTLVTAPKVLKQSQIFPARNNGRPKSSAVDVIPSPTGRHEGNETRREAAAGEKHEVDNQIRYEPFYSRTRRRLEEERRSKSRSKDNNSNGPSSASSSDVLSPSAVKHKENNIRGLAALVSFPGSGNTWFRYLLQQATGILTGSVYKDLGLMKSGFPAENIFNSSVLVVKTHEWGPAAFKMFDKAILLVREPEQAILAEFNRQSGGHVGFASMERFTRTEGRYWHQFVVNKLWLWEHTNLSWAKDFRGKLKIIYFDQLVDNIEETLRDVLHFINYKGGAINEDLMACAMARKEGIYKRRRRILRFDPFTKEMHGRIEEKRREVYEKLGRN